jgi:hypothetical protein
MKHPARKRSGLVKHSAAPSRGLTFRRAAFGCANWCVIGERIMLGDAKDKATAQALAKELYRHCKAVYRKVFAEKVKTT